MRTRLHVIAGDARGRNLEVPAHARPTAGRVREALFASLGDISGMQVLDLYAGSGAVAIEALSRGAAGAVLVDRHRDAIEACRANLETTGTGSRARVASTAVVAFLTGRIAPEAPFDLVWCDPPYGMDQDEIGAVCAALALPGWLAPDARVVVERAARDPLPGDAGIASVELEVTWERKYGDTLVTVLRSR